MSKVTADQLLAEHEPALRNFLGARCRDADLTAEMLQEVAARPVTAGPRITLNGNARVAARVAADHAQRQRARLPVPCGRQRLARPLAPCRRAPALGARESAGRIGARARGGRAAARGGAAIGGPSRATRPATGAARGRGAATRAWTDISRDRRSAATSARHGVDTDARGAGEDRRCLGELPMNHPTNDELLLIAYGELARERAAPLAAHVAAVGGWVGKQTEKMRRPGRRVGVSAAGGGGGGGGGGPARGSCRGVRGVPARA